jgi:hypothetical protein
MGAQAEGVRGGGGWGTGLRCSLSLLRGPGGLSDLSILTYKIRRQDQLPGVILFFSPLIFFDCTSM